MNYGYLYLVLKMQAMNVSYFCLLRTYTGRIYDNFAIVLQENCIYSCLNAYQKFLQRED